MPGRNFPTRSGTARRLTLPRLGRVAIGLIVVVAVVIGAVIGIESISSFVKTDGGHLAVVRDGGLFDTNKVQQVIQPSSSRTYVGLWSEVHEYPSNQRFFKVAGAADADTNETINVPTRDGVQVGIEGTFYFEINRDSPVMTDFDNAYGTRTYPVPGGSPVHAYDGDAGWSAFLAATLGNVVQNVMRREIGSVQCADLVASCALAQNSAASAPGSNQAGNDTIQRVQDAVNSGFASDVSSVLGGPYLTKVTFNLSKVDLPENVQNAINDAQAAFAGVTKSQAALKQAQIDAQTNEARQQGYNACPVCGQIDLMKAIPPNVQVYAPGANTAVPLTPGGR
jgi:regulator of protease activity HflC (stomatin/prohibitin superfamily)